MKCEDCLKVIEDYLDGELREREAATVRSHLSACEACAHELEALSDEQNLYALYRREIEVSPALWNGVAARIREEKRALALSPASRLRDRLSNLFGTPRLSFALTFALLILAVGATAGLMKYMQSNPSQLAGNQAISQKKPDAPQSPIAKENNIPAPDAGEKKGDADENVEGQAAQPKDYDKAAGVLAIADRAESRRSVSRLDSFTDGESPEQLVREAEQKYRAAIALLTRDARRRRTQLEPDVLARFDQTLATVDRAISETRRSARQQPDDPVAVQYMLAAYAKKVEVLREMATSRADYRGIQ